MPTFPDTRYIMARRVFEAAEAEPGDERTSRIVDAARVVVVDMDFELDGEVLPATGRGPGTRSHSDLKV